MQEDNILTILASDLLANATDADGDALSVRNLSASAGTLSDNGGGNWTLTPDAGFNGTISLSYEIYDGSVATAVTGDVTVSPQNDAPVVSGPVSGVIAEDGTITVTVADLLSNASDADGDALSIRNLVLAGSDGNLADNGDGSWTITPNANFNGTISLSYDVTDGIETVAGSYGLTVNAVNDAPDAEGARIALGTASLVSGRLTVSDADLADSGSTESLSYGINGSIATAGTPATFTTAAGGQVSIHADGTYSYDPTGAAGLNADSFTYEVTDAAGVTSSAVIDVVIGEAPSDGRQTGTAGHDHMVAGSRVSQLEGGAGDDYLQANDTTSMNRSYDGASIRSNQGHLEHNPGGAGSRTTWSLSSWVQLDPGPGVTWLYSAAGNSNDSSFGVAIKRESGELLINGHNTLVFGRVDFDQWASDAWLNVVIAVDTTQSAQADRLRMYVNGQEVSYETSRFWPTGVGAVLGVNGDRAHMIGRDGYGRVGNDMTQADFHFVDGQAMTADAFGEDLNGSWVPKVYTGSYGTTGYHLDFADSGNPGLDVSGTGNHLAEMGDVGHAPGAGPSIAVSGESTLIGGAGNDVLVGGAGTDHYHFGSGDGQDRLRDAGTGDQVHFGTGVDADEIWFEQSGNHLNARLLGSQDQITLEDWFAGRPDRVDSFVLENGVRLSATNVQALVSAMASWAALDGNDVDNITQAPAGDADIQNALSAWSNPSA